MLHLIDLLGIALHFWNRKAAKMVLVNQTNGIVWTTLIWTELTAAKPGERGSKCINLPFSFNSFEIMSVDSSHVCS